MTDYFPPETDSPAAEAAIRTAKFLRYVTELEASGDFRVLKKFSPPVNYSRGVKGLKGVFIDVETTGLDTERDKIIELAMVPFYFDQVEGRITWTDFPKSWLEDPGIPIPPEVTALTGLDSAQLEGKKIDDEEVKAFAGDAALFIAHNAKFDRRIAERRFPFFVRTPWGCSQREVPWPSITGSTGTKLDYLLYRVCGEFHNAHRAVDDCLVGIHLLAQGQFEGKTAFGHLLTSVRLDTHRIWADGASFDVKDTLKARGYEWWPGSADHAKCWFFDATAEQVEGEVAFLKTVYVRNPTIKRVSARDRYSIRI